MQHLKITPLSTLFFRNGKPFTMAEDSFAESSPLPPPSVIYGALRATWMAANGQPLDDANEKDKDKTLDLKVCWALPYSAGAWIFPCPLDCVGKMDESAKQIELAKPTASPIDYHSNSPLSAIPFYAKEVDAVDGLYVTHWEIEDYIKGSLAEKLDYKEHSSLFTTENKMGNMLADTSRSVEDGMLYQANMHRWATMFGDSTRHTELRVLLEGLDFKNGNEVNLIRLGGEAKIASLEVIEENLPDFSSSLRGEITQFKIYFGTPAIFKHGFLPEAFWDGKKGWKTEGSWHGHELAIEKVYGGRAIHFGGFDMKTNHPKPMHKAIPAGTVIHFRAKSPIEAGKLIEAFHQKSLSEIYPEQGFGFTLIAPI